LVFRSAPREDGRNDIETQNGRCGIPAFGFSVYKSLSSWESTFHAILRGRTNDKQTHLFIDDGRIAERPQGGRNLTPEVRQNHVWTLTRSRPGCEKKNMYSAGLAVRMLTYKICHHVPWPTRHDDTSGRERAVTRENDGRRRRRLCGTRVPGVLAPAADISSSPVHSRVRKHTWLVYT
jgi:hypothetical protein